MKKAMLMAMTLMLCGACSYTVSAQELPHSIQHGQNIMEQTANEPMDDGEPIPLADETYIPYNNAKYSLNYRVAKNGVVILGCNGDSNSSDWGQLVIPAQINGRKVYSIQYGAFSGCKAFSGSLTLPEGLTSIGDSAFSGCSGITGSLTLPNTLTTL